MNTKNKKCWLSGGVALLVTAGVAQAAVISQTKTFDGTPNYSSPLTFDQFDDNGGAYTLNSIHISVQLNTDAGSGLRIDNDGAEPASGTVEFGASGVISSSDVTLFKQGGGTFNGLIQSIVSKNMNLTPDDGDGALFSTIGTDYDSLTSEATSKSDAAFINPFVFTEYIGTGTYDITYDVSQHLDVSSFGGSQVQFDPIQAGGSITVEYDFEDAIPEPTSIAMIGVACGATLFIRRTFLI